MANLALAGLVIPYLLKGNNLAAAHAALSVIRVASFESASDHFGVALREHPEFSGRGFVGIGNGCLQIAGQTSEAALPFDPQRRSPTFDLAETSIDFEIFVPRDGSLIVARGATTIVVPRFSLRPRRSSTSETRSLSIRPPRITRQRVHHQPRRVKS